MIVFKLLFAAFLLSGLYFSADCFGAVANTPQTNSGGGVTAKVVYLNPGTAEEPRFQVVLDTHSVNLDAYDLRSITVLRDDSGKTYTATRVENKGSGHHRETTVSFPKITQDARRVELVIKDVGGVKERVFRWTLK